MDDDKEFPNDHTNMFVLNADLRRFYMINNSNVRIEYIRFLY